MSAIAQGVQAPHHDPDRAVLRRNCPNAVLGAARHRAHNHAKGRWMADLC